MEDSAKGPHHPRPEVERPQLLQPHPYLATPLPMRKEKKETLYAEAFFISLLFISTIVVIHQVLYLLFLV